MFYEINVALKNRHFFATAERSIGTREELVRVMEVFEKAFPESEGYKMTVTHYRKIGEMVPLPIAPQVN